ncbi:hypothetical protein BL250_01015 [Erwinia sp. OLTSP20]|uniref:HutD/Ves family protein n=1 Tax=unclassified Erwinia TaxID=2622719 RepID=UPI000C19093F|nr:MULTISPECIES: HutD family protein [unclassified Erwinia]PIJ48687.1 hypothetical protein BV501_15435 [Erwinia sp. OAMSP11]PIJ69311.1 hypothetical protein BK416_14380 [Erwinia sp. OLSSP12]PIJ79145.1 hypothetical protein BLD47_14685 [Erwinia sp. OLCASP19]PIJ80671.1 hypothetical protein BLD46_13845 [Erwinia sp. OLMTSP26]PIJ82822.1 hypothetical protein BLD49_13745 [Erwinia sp. OLMDSP33]
MKHFFAADKLPVSPWRNGGGETREIMVWPPDSADFSWRLSIATLSQDGVFSSFPGVDRIITLVSGADVTLSSPHWQHHLQKGQPFAFAGEEQVFARLNGGVSQDFNLMTRRASHQATMILTDSAQQAPAGSSGVVYVLAGSWQVGGRVLQQSQGLWWHQHRPDFTPQHSGSLLLYAIIRCR